MRFAQAHGAGKTAIEFVERKHLFLQLSAMFHQQIGIAHGQHAAAYAHRSASKKRIRRSFHGVRQLHAADVMVLRSAQHAALHIGIVRGLGTRGQDDFFAIEGGFLHIHHSVERRVFLASDALASVEHRVKGFAGVIGKAFALRQALGG